MDRNELLAEIDAEISSTEAQMGVIARRPLFTPGLFLAALVLIGLNIAMILLSRSYGSVWIASTLLVTLVLTVLSLLPTTRSTAGIGGILIPRDKLRNIKGSNKKVLAALLVSSFLVGGVPMMPGMIVLLSGSILFAIVNILTMSGELLAMLWIVMQCLLMIAFYLWLMHLRPYSADFLDNMVSTVLSLKGEDRSARTGLELGMVITISAIVLIGVFVLPGFSLRFVTMETGTALLRYVIPFLVAMATHLLIVRGWQVDESRRWAEGFLLNKRAMLQRLKADALAGCSIEIGRERLLVTRIMRLQSHDIFGLLPIFSFFPDLDVFLTKDLQEELACITPSEALRNTGY